MQIQFLLRLINCSSKVKLPLKNRTEITLRRKGGGKRGYCSSTFGVTNVARRLVCVCVVCLGYSFFFFLVSYMYRKITISAKREIMAAAFFRPPPLSPPRTTYDYRIHITKPFYLICLFLNSSNRSNPLNVDFPVFYFI